MLVSMTCVGEHCIRVGEYNICVNGYYICVGEHSMRVGKNNMCL